jgi:UDP-2-acetamido-3-amino-2,3-dideoxy-glucuronate N-acetyltransferase
MSAPFVHPSAVLDEGVELGEDVKIWHFCHVMAGARIGPGALLSQGCFVGKDVTIGARVRIQNHVSVFDGVTLEDDVFVGPSAVFTNVRNPRAFVKRGPPFERILARRGATIGANATVLPGVELGVCSFVGAGALVRAAVPAFALVVGVPARRIGWISRHGERLHFEGGVATCPATGERYRLSGEAVEPLA